VNGTNGINGRDGNPGRDGINGLDGKPDPGNDAQRSHNDAQRSHNDAQKKENKENSEVNSADVAKILKEIKEVQDAIGKDELPYLARLITDDPQSGVPKPRTNLVEIMEWIVLNLDAVAGVFPAKVAIQRPDGKVRELQYESISHGLDLILEMQASTAEDTSAALATAAAAAVAASKAQVAATQSGDIGRAITDFLGFAARPKSDQVKIAISPAAQGVDGKLQNQELEDFLKPSRQSYVTVENAEKYQLLPIIQRILQDGEIARAALFQPLHGDDLKGLTGDDLKRQKKSKKEDSDWEKYIKGLEAQGIKATSSKKK
jgi:hypothetical protein